MEEWNAKGRMWIVNLVISSHVLWWEQIQLLSIVHGVIGVAIVKMGRKSGKEYCLRKTRTEKQNVKTMICKLKIVIVAVYVEAHCLQYPPYHTPSTANGHPGLIGATVLKLVIMVLKQEQELKPKLQGMKEKTVKATTQKLKNASTNNVLLTANGQAGLDGLTVPKIVTQEYQLEPGLMNKRLYMGEMNVMETK